MILDDGGIEAVVGNEVPLIVYGIGLTDETEIKFTSAHLSYGQNCEATDDMTDMSIKTGTRGFSLSKPNDEGTMAKMMVDGASLPLIPGQETFYVCMRRSRNCQWVHQGSEDNSLEITVTLPFGLPFWVPLWVMCALIAVLLCLSGIFSGNEFWINVFGPEYSS